MAEKPKNKGGRPSKLTDQLQSKIIAYIQAGGYVETAAVANGVSKQSLYAWMKKGAAQKSGKYRKFLDAIEKAFAVAEMIDVQNINKAATTNWQASAWRLERKHPKRWGRTEMHKLEHTGKDGKPIQVQQEVDHSLVATRVVELLKENEEDEKSEEFK